MNKKQALEKIVKEIESCSICQKDSVGKAVPGEGNPNAQIVFIGEAPGKQESLSGRPFVGRSGQLLRQNIRSLGLLEDDVFITSAVKYLPQKGTPTPSQIQHARSYLKKQLEIIRPKIIVLLGSVAAQSVLGEKVSIAKEHGTRVQKNGIRYFLSYHPAAAIRFQYIRKLFEKDFQLFKEFYKDII